MPFGISSAPEVFQWRMHELIEGLTGIEVLADDFIAVGYGDTYKEALRDHDRNLLAFLKQCEKRTICLNLEKVKLDQAIVRAIAEMPTPTDKAGVQRLLELNLKNKSAGRS